MGVFSAYSSFTSHIHDPVSGWPSRSQPIQRRALALYNTSYLQSRSMSATTASVPCAWHCGGQAWRSGPPAVQPTRSACSALRPWSPPLRTPQSSSSRPLSEQQPRHGKGKALASLAQLSCCGLQLQVNRLLRRALRIVDGQDKISFSSGPSLGTTLVTAVAAACDGNRVRLRRQKKLRQQQQLRLGSKHCKFLEAIDTSQQGKLDCMHGVPVSEATHMISVVRSRPPRHLPNL